MSQPDFSRTIALRFWGDEAAFTIPHLRADPHTHPCPTPSAAAQMLAAIYRKPEFEWEIVAIHVIRPLRYTTTRRKALLHAGVGSTDRDRTLQTMTTLVDVEYVIEARLVTNPKRAVREAWSYLEEAVRRFRLGNQWRQPFMGWKEFIAHWELIVGPIPDAIPLTTELGPMLLDQFPVDPARDVWAPLVIRTRLVDGIMHLPRAAYDAFRDERMIARHRYMRGEPIDVPVPVLPPSLLQPSAPAETLLDALVERAAVATIPSGCDEVRVGWVLRLAADGAFLGLDKLDKEDPRCRTVVPELTPARTSGLMSKPVDDFTYTLGAGKPGELERPGASHALFRMLLGAMDHPTPRALLAFLDSPTRPLVVPLGAKLTSEQHEVVMATPGVAHMDAKPRRMSKKAIAKLKLVTRGVLTENDTTRELYACIAASARQHHVSPDDAEVLCVEASPTDRLLVEVEGQPEWWLSPAVLDHHAGRLDELNRSRKGSTAKVEPRRGTCCMCGADEELARLFSSTRGLGSMISFNQTAFESHGNRKAQGYNVPTCRDCAVAIGRGLDDLARDRDLHHRQGDDLHLLWWPRDATSTAPWPLFEAAFDKEATPEARATALDALTDGHLVIVERLMARLAVRRYVAVSADLVRKNVAAWNNAFSDAGFEGPTNVWVAAVAMMPPSTAMPKGQLLDRQMEWLYLSLLADEPIPLLTQMRRQMSRDIANHESNTNRRRAAILLYGGLPTPMEDQPMTPKEQYARLMGRAFARAAWIQVVTRRPQRSLLVTHLRAAARSPTMVVQLVRQHAVNKPMKRGGEVRHDQEATTLLAEADQVMNGELPGRFSTREQSQFHLGVIEQEQIHQTRREEKKARITEEAAQAEEAELAAK